MRYSKRILPIPHIIEEVRMKNDIVDVDIPVCEADTEEEVPILGCVRSIMRKPFLFRNAIQADVLLLRLRSRRKCIQFCNGI